MAVFRITLFATICLSVDPARAARFSQMLASLQFSPYGLRHIRPHVPITAALATGAANTLRIFAILAAIGLATPVSVAVTAVLAVYVFGLPQLYGKVYHLHHHLIWSAVLMATSPCADVLSGDAAISAFRRSRYGKVDPPTSGPGYALALRFVWITGHDLLLSRFLETLARRFGLGLG